jgi:hypothetical protein
VFKPLPFGVIQGISTASVSCVGRSLLTGDERSRFFRGGTFWRLGKVVPLVVPHDCCLVLFGLILILI